MKFFFRFLPLYLIPAAVAIILDLLSKVWIFSPRNDDLEFASRELIPGFLYFTRSLNPGIAFGMFQGGADVFLYLVPVLLVGISVYTWTLRHSVVEVVLMGFVFGGAVGNYYDRLFVGKVRDFIDVRFGDYNYPIFNLADAFISCGVFALLVYSFFIDRKREAKD